jgi:MFS family permease
MRNPFGFRLVAPLGLGVSLNPINSTMISTALVPIALHFDATAAEAGWVISALYLTTAIAQPTMGRLADVLGARRILVFSLCLVMLAGIGGALAPTLATLIAVRVLLGLGTSGAYPSAMRIIRNQADRYGMMPPRLAMSAVSMAAISTTAIGPFLGGLLTDAYGWPSIFLINVPLAALAMLLVRRWIPADDTALGSVGKLLGETDIIGIGLFTLCLLSAMLSMDSLHLPAWLGPVVSVSAGLALILHSLRRPQPFIDARMIIENSPLALTFLRVALNMLVYYGMTYAVAQWLQVGAGHSSAEAGLIMMPMSIAAVACTFLGGFIKTIKTNFMLGPLTAIGGCIAMILTHDHTPAPLIALGLVPFGITLGIFASATQAAVYLQARPSEAGTAAGLQRTAASIGAISGATIIGSVYGIRASEQGLHQLAFIMIGVSILVFAISSLDRRLGTLRL